MPLPPEAIAEFRSLYKEKFGKELTLKEATEEAETLLNLYSLSQGKPIFYEN